MTTLTNPDGSTITVAYEPAPPPPPMLVGEAAAANNVLSGHPTYAPYQQIGLDFNQPGHGLNAAVIAVGAKAGCLVCSCLKDDPTAALLNPWLDAVAAAGKPAWLALYQENNLNHYRAPDAYKAGYATADDIIAAHPAAPLVTLLEKFGSYHIDTDPAKDWRPFWTGRPALWDVYAQTSYPVADAMYGATMAACDEMAASSVAATDWWWGIGETGLVWLKAKDASGQGQADAFASYVGYLGGKGARCVLGWDSSVGAADFTFSPPTKTTWRALSAAAVAQGAAQ